MGMTTALMGGFTRSMRAMAAWTSSAAVTSLRRTRSAWATASRVARSASVAISRLRPEAPRGAGVRRGLTHPCARSHRERHAVAAGIGAARPAIAVDLDAVHGREGEALRAARDAIALRLQLARHVVRDAVAHVDDVAGGREARRRHRLADRHVEVDDVEDGLHHAEGDVGTAWRADDQERAVAAEHDGRAHGAEAALAGCERAGTPGPRIEHAHAA